jgi:hypothetical protein
VQVVGPLAQYEEVISTTDEGFINEDVPDCVMIRRQGCTWMGRWPSPQM